MLEQLAEQYFKIEDPIEYERTIDSKAFECFQRAEKVIDDELKDIYFSTHGFHDWHLVECQFFPNKE